jgi:tripartite-type tricarboxylate transporter receptor subunit TctC
MQSIKWRALTASVATILVLALPCVSAADPVEDFYRGKSIDLSIGFGPGGGYDAYSRLLSRHMGSFIPGNPVIVPRNMPGGGGLVVANYLYNAAPRDGLHLAMFGSFNGMEPLYGNANARFDPTKFTWIGNMNVDVEACGVWRTSGIRTLADMQRRLVLFGSSGKASTTSQHALALKNLVGAKVRVVFGYQGTRDINLAMRRGEVTGSCGIYLSSAAAEWDEDLKDGDLKLVVQFGRRNAPFFGDATNIYDELKTEEDRQVADFIFRPNEIGRPVAAPPDTPPERAAALREAFARTMRDPSFMAEAQSARMPIDPTSGADVTKLFSILYAEPGYVIERAKTIINAE